MPFATPDLCDEFGDEVRVAEPVFRDWGGVDELRGADRDAAGLRGQRAGSPGAGDAGAGRVLVVDGGGSLRTALVGGNLAALAHENGWSGIVVYGCIRDAAELAAHADRGEGAPRRSAEERQGGRGRAGRPGDFRGRHLRPRGTCSTRTGTASWSRRDLLGSLNGAKEMEPAENTNGPSRWTGRSAERW